MKTILSIAQLFVLVLVFCFPSNGLAETKVGWEVIGIHIEKKLIAYRNVYTELGSQGEDPASCAYPGMEDGYGVELGVWSVETNQSIQTWDVYKAVFDKKDCTPHATAKKNLNAAKVYFSSKGIDISTPPKGIQKTDNHTYDVIGPDKKTYAFSLVNFAELPIPDDEMGGYILKRWIRNAKSEVVFEIEEQATKAMASTLSIEYPLAYVLGDSVVFMEKKNSSSMRHSTTTYRFTPAIKIQ